MKVTLSTNPVSAPVLIVYTMRVRSKESVLSVMCEINNSSMSASSDVLGESCATSHERGAQGDRDEHVGGDATGKIHIHDPLETLSVKPYIATSVDLTDRNFREFEEVANHKPKLRSSNQNF